MNASTAVALYKIVNLVNGKMYIGQTTDPLRRLKRHLAQNNGCVKLRNAIQKYGQDNFKFDVLCWCAGKTEANEIEMLLIELADSCNNGYNITVGGGGTGAGQNNPFFGKKHTPKTRQVISAKRRGKKMPEGFGKKIAEANKNRVVSEATKEKLRAKPKSALCSERTVIANKKRVWSEESKAKLAAHNLGKKMSDEAKAKIAAANKRRIWTPESRAKLAASKTKKILIN